MVPETAPAGRGNPNVAAVLTWLIPGAGHVYIGRPIFGLVAFLVVNGIFLLGVRLTQGMAFEFLQTDLRSLIAPVLTPEVGNLSAIIWHMREYGFGPPFPRPWPPSIDLGTWLTAFAGMLNGCLACWAHFDARVPKGLKPTRPSPALLVFAAWVVPGLGHWLQGRKLRGVLVFAIVTGFVLVGTWLAQGANLDRERHFYYWSGQFLAGAPAWILEVLHGHALVHADIRYVDAGLAFAAVGGLLNILAWLDVFGVAEREALESLVPETEPAPVPAREIA